MEQNLSKRRMGLLGISVAIVVCWNIAITEGAQHCLECLSEDVQFCNASSNLKECGSDRDMCFTKITNLNGKLIAMKGCMLAQICHQAASLNDVLCDQGVALGTCTYCCIGDSCNYDRFKYSGTIPTTAQPEVTTTELTTEVPTTAPITDIISTVVPSTCENENLTRCTTDYQDAILVAMSDPRTNFPYFCRQVPVMFQCIAEAMTSCCPDNQLALHDQLNVVSHTMWAMCPRKCDVMQAQFCTSGTLTKIITDVIAGNATCELLRKYVIIYQQCLVINIGTCGTIDRICFENRATVIKSAVEMICNNPQPTMDTPATDSPTDTTTEPTTADPGCQPELAEACLIQLATNLTQPGDADYDIICSKTIPETEECLQNYTSTCPESMKIRIEQAYNFTLDLMTKNCSTTTEIPTMCNTTAARQCALEIWRIIDEERDYGLACSMVEDTVDCVLSNVTGCTQREKESLNRTLDLVLQRLEGKCEKVGEMEGNCTNMVLEEGGEEKIVKFHSNYDPKILCGGEEDCKVYLVVDFEEKNSPKCQNGEVIPQVVCRSEPKPSSGPSCGIHIKSDNWQQTQRVYLAATLDGKVDGDQTVSMSLMYKKVIKGQVEEVMTLATCKITIIDHDTTGQCGSLNDPHIQTFDGVVYDNFFEGHFVLYRHTSLPYEVQVLYQKCGRYATCNCGVAVKSGDYVFFAELCRRRSQHCRSRRGCRNLLKARSYVWDEVTPGTRLFKRSTGFEVLLPHGTRVTIQYLEKLSLINVWVTPSAADFMSTAGLCGMYDQKKEKDLLFPNGDPYTGKNIGQGKQPYDFCRSWRITDRSQMFYNGAPYNPYYPKEYCVCNAADHHLVDCGPEHLVSTCDISKEGEIQFDDLPTLKTEDDETRQKRAVNDDDEFDFDLEYEPEEIDASTRQWKEADARTFCQAYMDGSNLVVLCKFQAGVEILHYVNICVQDILLADDTKYAISALEGVKADCINVVKSDPKFTNSDTNKHVVVKIDEANCPMECSGNGDCDEGKCRCKDNYVGESCNVRADAVPKYINTDFDGLCNKRRTECTSIVVYAEDIIKSDSLTCHLTAVEVTEEGVTNTSNHLKVQAEYFSSNQVICRVRTDKQSRGYYVDLSNDGHRVSGDPLLYIMHDPNCFSCQITDNGATCSRKTDTCVVEGKCFVAGEMDPSDACSICDPSSSDSTLKKMKSIACLGPFVIIIIAAVVILVVIILAVIIKCCCCKRCQKKNKKSWKSKMEEGVASELMRRYQK